MSMSPLGDDCDDCVPNYLRPASASFASLRVLTASLPFLLTFVTVATLVLKRLYPLLLGQDEGTSRKPDAKLPTHNLELAGQAQLQERGRKTRLAKISKSIADPRKVSKVVFAATIALSAVLVELILCEISNSLDSEARRIALNWTLPTLLVLLVIVTPALEIRSVLAAAGLAFHGTGRVRQRVAWFFEAACMGTWLLAFWYLGHGLVAMFREDLLHPELHSFSSSCLERVGIVGISLMASLAGFAAVSALWQTFGVRDRTVSEADIARKQAGLDAAEEMLGLKKSRLRAIERKLSESRDEGFFSRVASTIRGNSDSHERSALQLEISGLQMMRMSLNNGLYSLRHRRAAQLRSHTLSGRLLAAFSTFFAVYCAYRLFNTSLTVARRALFGSTSASQDLVTHLLALLARHWDNSLNQALWSRQISFLLSGIMLLLAFNAALQTFLLLGRAFPSLLTAAFGGANFALVVSQVCASYVISSALLLRSSVPSEVGGVISDVLGAPLDTRKVDAWFESWFVGAAAVTVLGIWVGRRFRGVGEDGEGEDGLEVEMGDKLS